MVHCGCMAVPARMAGIRAASRTLDAIEYSLVQSKNANSVIGIHTASRVCRVKRRRTGVREYKGQHAGPTTGRRANPRRFWSLTVQRTCPFWFPYRDVFTPASGYSVCLITFVSLLGLFDLLRDAKAIGWLLSFRCCVRACTPSPCRHVLPLPYTLAFAALRGLFCCKINSSALGAAIQTSAFFRLTISWPLSTRSQY